MTIPIIYPFRLKSVLKKTPSIKQLNDNPHNLSISPEADKIPYTKSALHSFQTILSVRDTKQVKSTSQINSVRIVIEPVLSGELLL